MNKNFKIFGVRQSLIGDMVMGLPVLEALEERFPNSYKYFHVSRGHSEVAPIFFNHPLIDKIVISQVEGGYGERDVEISKSCDLSINTTPQHPGPEDWFNHFSCVEETARMAGLNHLSVKSKRPKLSKWFDTKKEDKAISIWPFAGYAKAPSRSPSLEWWKKMVDLLIKEGYAIKHFGHYNEPRVSDSSGYSLCTSLSLFDQIKESLGCGVSVGTDSGSSWILGAYGHPQVSLITNWLWGHRSNLLALAPENCDNLNINIFSPGSLDRINQEDVLSKIKNF